jgi:hyaluronan synthase
VHYFLIFYAFVTCRFLLVRLVARGYRPYQTKTGTVPGGILTSPAGIPASSRGRTLAYVQPEISVIIPVVDEPVEVFQRVLISLINRRPRLAFEIIVVVNGPRNPTLEGVCGRAQQEYSYPVRLIWQQAPGKRPAIVRGVKESRGNIIVLLDSDTIARGDALVELVKPFEDQRVGGVTTHQSIYQRWRSLSTIFADWMEDVRAGPGGTMEAMSARGTVGCLPGRMIAIRKSIILRHEAEFLGLDGKGKFLGIWLPVSDDRELTNHALRDGYKTVFQRTARVQTDAPTKWRVFWRQQLRWARGSQYNTMRMTPFYLTHPRTWFLAFLYWSDILIPFWWVGTMFNAAWKVVVQGPMYYSPVPWWLQLILVASGILLSAASRNLGHFIRRPWDIPLLPIYVVLLSLLLTPIRIIGFFVMARDAGWGTRAGANAAQKAPRNYLGWIPPILGTLLLVGFCAAGPLLEASGLSLSSVWKHWP